MDIKTYNHFGEFLNDFMSIRKISQTEFSKALGFKSSSYVNQIVNKIKDPSESFIEKLSNFYTEYSKADYLALLQRHLGNPKRLKKQQNVVTNNNTDINEVDHQIDEKKVRVNAIAEEETSGKSNNNDSLINSSPNEQINVNNPASHAILTMIAVLSDDLQTEILEQLQNIINSTLSNKYAIYTHKELKEHFLSTFKGWRKQVGAPGYDVEEITETKQVYVEGNLQLNQSKVFFVFESNEQYLSIATQYQDRNYLNDFIQLVPGAIAIERKSGSLGSVYNDVSLYIVRIFNPKPLIVSVQAQIHKLGINLNQISFKDEYINTYLKQKKEMR